MSTSHGAGRRRRRRVRIGRAAIDDVTMVEAVEAIVELVARQRGGFICTPNVDHVVLLEDDARLRGAYERASLVLADGMPILWASRLLGAPLREKVSGSDLMEPLLLRAAEERWRVYLVGGGEGVAERAAARLKTEAPGLEIVGIDARVIDLDADHDGAALDPLVAGIVAARPDLVLVALGCPKQEIVMDRIARSVRPAVCAGIGAGLDFVAGTVSRAPRWISAAGLEWLYRLAREPRRLWRRYLVRDPWFAGIVARELVTRVLGR
jgi:N-acetylglucosaminyldiphosphoundecaprenol N-acetyl-beta-D-mannosaminyltransferase